MTNDPEPHEAFAADTKALARSTSRRLLDRGRVYLTSHLAVLLGTAIGGGAAAIALLPIVAGVVCAVVAITAVITAIYSRRLMADERRKRHYAYVQGKRGQQRELRAQMAIDNAILTISGDRDAAALGRERNTELIQAVRNLQARVAQSRSAGQPQPRGAAQRASAIPAGPDLVRVSQRLKARQADVDALEAEIQSLVLSDDTELVEDAVAQRHVEKELTAAVRHADRVARDRRRRGQTPTALPGSEAGMQIKIGPEGLRDVRPVESQPTPEQLTGDALTLRPPRR